MLMRFPARCPRAVTNFRGISMGWSRSKAPLKLPSCLPRAPASFIRWGCLAYERPRPRFGLGKLPHDPEKWVPVFRSDHAQTNRLSKGRFNLVEPCPSMIRKSGFRLSGGIMLGPRDLQGTL